MAQDEVYKINGSPSHTPPLLSGFVGGGAAERGAFFFLTPLLHTTLILWGKSSSFFSGRRRGTAPSSSEAPEAGLERQISASSARPPARSTDMHCTLQSHCKKSAIRANKKKPCLRKKNPRYFLSSPLCRHPHRSGVRVLRVLEGHLHQRHLGAQLHLAHRRQAVQGVLRKSRSFTFWGGGKLLFLSNMRISQTQSSRRRRTKRGEKPEKGTAVRAYNVHLAPKRFCIVRTVQAQAHSERDRERERPPRRWRTGRKKCLEREKEDCGGKRGREREGFCGGEGGEGLGTIKNANGLKVSRGKEEDDVVARGALGRPTDRPRHTHTSRLTPQPCS